MKLVKKECIGIQKVYNTNVDKVHNYITRGGIINHNCLIDTDYQGEIFFDIHNIGSSAQYIYPGEKIVQLVLMPVNMYNAIEVPFEELYKEHNSERGDGAMGSTGDC